MLSIVTHELIHRITKPEDIEFVSELLQLSQVDVSIKQFSKKALLMKSPFLLSKGSTAADTAIDMYRLNYGSQNSWEFLAVGGQFYLKGEEKFMEVYGVFIGEEKAAKFYTHMRDNIFKGTEYRDYQRIKMFQPPTPSKNFTP